MKASTVFQDSLIGLGVFLLMGGFVEGKPNPNFQQIFGVILLMQLIRHWVRK